MQRFIILVILSLLSRLLYAQHAKPSGVSAKRIVPMTDTQHVNKLLKTSWIYIFKPQELNHDLDTALVMLRQAQELSKRLSYLRGLGMVNYGFFLVLLEKGDHIRANQYAQRAISIFTTAHCWQELGDLYLDMTRFYTLERDELPERVALYQKALNNYKLAGNIYKQGDVYKELADHHQIQENYARSLVELHNALTLYRQANRSNLERIYDLLGFVSGKLGDYKEALSYGYLAIKTAENQHDSTLQLCTIHNRLGLVYHALGQYKEANIQYQTALQIALKHKQNAYILNVSGNIAQLLLQQGKPGQALRFFTRMSMQYPPLSTESRLAIALHLLNIYSDLNQVDKAQFYCDQLVDLLAKKGNGSVELSAIYEAAIRFLIKSNQYKAALSYLKINQERGQRTGSTTVLSKNHFLWFKLDSLMANYPAAIRHYQQYESLQDSLLNLTKSRHIAQLEIQFETQKKDQDLRLKQRNIQLLTKQSQLQQNQLEQTTLLKNGTIAFTVLLVLLLGVGYSRYQIKQRSNTLLEDKQIEINRKNQELEHNLIEKEKILTDKEQLILEKDHLLDEREWMLREIHHRVKNNLQIITSLLNSQASYLTDKAALTAILESQNRVHAMALIHQKLYQSDRLSSISMGNYIQEIVNYLLVTYNRGTTIQKRIEIDPVELDVTLAIPLGLILNEAVTNSLKYAFPDSRSGSIGVKFSQLRSSHYQLIIWDDGIGFPDDIDPTQIRTLGMSLIRGLSEQIEGTLTIKQIQGVQLCLTFSEGQFV